MLYRPTSPPLPRQRMSPAAMVTAGAIHAALLWLLIQHSPVERAIRYVVYQYVKPISPVPNAPGSRAITLQQRPRAVEPPPVFSNTPQSSVALKTTTQLPETLQSKNPVQASPVPQAMAPVEPPPEPWQSPAPVPEVALPAAPVPVEPGPPEPVPEPAPSPKISLEVPAAAPAPEPMPVPPPAAAAVPAAAAPVPVPVSPVLAPAPIPVAEPAPALPLPSPVPAPVAAPAPVIAPAAVPALPRPIERLQGPVVDVPVPANSPAAANATPVLVAPWPGAATGSATPGSVAASPAGEGLALPRPAPPLPAAPAVSPFPPLHPGPYRPQRSLADLANEQLRRDNKPKAALEDAMEGAAVDDCLHAPREPGKVAGLLAIPGLAVKALAGKCPK